MKTTRTSLRDRLRLPASRLRRRVAAASLPPSRIYLRHRTHIIGQDRAIQAMELGLKLEGPGFNIFLSGPSGTGRMTTARHILGGFKQPRKPLRDFAYVHNFLDPERPRLLELSPGQGVRLKRAMDNLIASAKRELPRALATERYRREHERIVGEFQRKEHELVSAFQEEVRRARFTLVEMQSAGTVEHDVVPVINKEPKTMAEVEDLARNGKISLRRFRRIENRHRVLRNRFEGVQRQTRALAREMNDQLGVLDRQTASAIVDRQLADLRDQFPKESVQDYLDDVREALLERTALLVRPKEEAPAPQEAGPQDATPDPFAVFRVNVILNNAHQKGCPVITENNPTPVRLFGTVERGTDENGRTEADFMNIRAGSLLRADGGFLVVNAEDLLVEPMAWKALKRALSTGFTEIRMPEGPMALMSSALKPEPIPLSVKAILLGDEDIYRALYLTEDEFRKTFKIKAEFDVEMEFSGLNLEKFMAFVHRVISEEDLLPLTRPAAAVLVEEAVRDVEDQQRITTRFRVVADLLREAAFCARQERRRRILPQDMCRAIEQRRQRVNLAEEKYRQSIEDNVVMVETRGARVGQVNGLAVFDLGDYSFGKPCRITASVAVGRDGFVNIERESGLSGAIHDKGVYILSGFLKDRFGQHFPLALDASVCFEQSYGEIDGDSASSTEAYAILSALSGVPLSQEIAVTGSISQRGDIQPIGGVNHKIEGFFEICKSRGLTGSQGVLIPRGNLRHLMLREDVVEAVRRGQFSIWAVSSVDQGIEILTGVPAGSPDAEGRYPAESINGRVEARLRQMAETWKRFSGN